MPVEPIRRVATAGDAQPSMACDNGGTVRAAGRGLPARRVRRTPLLERDAVPLAVVLDMRHVGSHQCQPASAGQGEPIGVAAVGHIGRTEAFSLIAYFGPESVWFETTFHLDLFVGVFLVAVSDRVADGLFEGEMDSQQLFGRPAERLEFFKERLQEALVGVETTRKRLFYDAWLAICGHGRLVDQRRARVPGPGRRPRRTT